MAMTTQARVAVHLQKNNGPARLASFTDCILSFFGYETTGIGAVYIQLKENRLTISNTKYSSDDQPVLIKHPSFCPIFNIQKEELKKIPEDVTSRGINVGVAILLESGDGKVLLTKRSQHLRIFPGLWVPPGGHVECNESLIDAGLRELNEETGLLLTSTDCVKDEIKLLALWESVYPAKLSVGLPKRHHTVIYFHAKLKESLTADHLESQLKFDPNEVGACAWMNRDIITKIVEACEETSLKEISSSLTFSAVVLNDNNEQCKKELPLAPLLKTLPTDSDIERVSTGTKFALEQFLKL